MPYLIPAIPVTRENALGMAGNGADPRFGRGYHNVPQREVTALHTLKGYFSHIPSLRTVPQIIPLSETLLRS